MITIMLLKWWWWLSWQRSSWPSCSITLRQGTRVDLLVTPLLHVVSRILMRITVGRSYTYKSQISILEKSPGLFFSTLTSPPFTPLKGLGDNMRAGSQEDGSVLLHCYRDFIQSWLLLMLCILSINLVIPFFCFHKSPPSVCVLHVSFFSAVHCFVKLRCAWLCCALCVPIADYLSIIATVLGSHHSNASILFSSSFVCCCFLSLIIVDTYRFFFVSTVGALVVLSV